MIRHQNKGKRTKHDCRKLKAKQEKQIRGVERRKGRKVKERNYLSGVMNVTRSLAAIFIGKRE